MLVLLPPSESKNAPVQGSPVTFDRLSYPTLTTPREEVLDALIEVSGTLDAPDVLGVGPSLADEVARNTGLRTAPAAPAREVYSGVLYGAAGMSTLAGPVRQRAARTVRTVSALWGLVGPEDAVPAYRLSMGTALPGPGPLARFWRPHLEAALPADPGLVVDCRSAAYAAAWVPPAPAHVTVRVERERDGRRTVVSHWAKHARGALVGHLVRREAPDPTTPAELTDAALELVGTGPLGHAGPGPTSSTLIDAAVTAGPRGTHVLTLVVA